MRKTHALIQVAVALMDPPNAEHWGYDLSRRTRVRSGVVYPLLTRLLDLEWLEDGWEDPAIITDRRPPRRYYRVTERGRSELANLLYEAIGDDRFTYLILPSTPPTLSDST